MKLKEGGLAAAAAVTAIATQQQCRWKRGAALLSLLLLPSLADEDCGVER